MKFYQHVRLAGVVMALAGCVMPNIILLVAGWLVVILGTTWGVDSLEKRVREPEDE